MHIRAHIQPSRLLAGSVVEDLLQLLTAVVVQVFGCRNDETDHALRRPATKKRQGTKSRAVG